MVVSDQVNVPTALLLRKEHMLPSG